MAKLLVSFSTRPGMGSEGGVGWEFLRGAALLCQDTNEQLFVMLDARDVQTVAAELHHVGLSHCVALIPVRVPRPLLDIYGDRRTRQTYLGWLPKARIAARRIIRAHGIDVAHQVTFATATMPSVIGGIDGVKKVWGPINVPSSTVSNGDNSRRIDRLRLGIAHNIGRLNAQGIDTLVATNGFTAHVLSDHKGHVHMEPNIIAEPMFGFEKSRSPDLFTFSGNLIELKRPWIAVKAMQTTGLQDFRLQIIGDGPLKSSLESYVRQERLDNRIQFCGRLPKDQATQRVAESRLLVHPSVREGASWVVGEAAAAGVASVVFADTGADSTVRLCANGGVVCTPKPEQMIETFAAGIEAALLNPQPAPSNRWRSSRLPKMIDRWWKN